MSVQHPGRQENVNKKRERASTGKRIVMDADGEEKGGENCYFFFEGETQTLHFPHVVRAG